MSANFVGAFLGIIITFGTTALINNHSRHATANRATLIAIARMERDITEMEYQFDKMQYTNGIFRYVLERYPDRFDAISADTLAMFCDCIIQPHIFVSKHSYSNILDDDSNLWNNFDDLELLYSLNDCNSIANTLLELYGDISDYHTESYKRLFETVDITASTPDEIVRTYIKMPATRNFMEIYNSYAALMPQLTAMLRVINDQNKQRAGITDEELRELFPDLYASGDSE